MANWDTYYGPIIRFIGHICASPALTSQNVCREMVFWHFHSHITMCFWTKNILHFSEESFVHFICTENSSIPDHLSDMTLLDTNPTAVYILKGNSANCTHWSVFTAFSESYCICEQRSIESFVVPEEVACNLINCTPVMSLNCQVALWVM